MRQRSQQGIILSMYDASMSAQTSLIFGCDSF
jgi:hypothetical protein